MLKFFRFFLFTKRKILPWLVLGNICLAALQFIDPLLFGKVIGLLAAGASFSAVTGWIGVWALVGLTGIAASMVIAWRADRLAHSMRLEAMARFYDHALSLPPAFHNATDSGRLMKIMITGVDAMFNLVLSFLRNHLATFIAVVVLLPLSLLLNWRLALVLMVLIIIFSGLTWGVIRRTEGGQARAQRWHLALAGTAQDALANVTLVQSYTGIGAERARFDRIASEVISHQFPVLTWWAMANVLTRAASTMAVITIVTLGSVMLLAGTAQIGDIVSFIGLALLLIGRLEGAMGFVAQLSAERPNLAAYFAVFDAPNMVPEASDAPALRPGAGEVVFDAVDFAYRADVPVLHGVSFVARPGSRMALVGTTGAGKSTAMALLERLWDPDRGAIRIDGQDIKGVSLASLRAAIGVVFQDSPVLNRSVRDNLLLGKPDATDAELFAALRLAQAEDFVRSMPDGLDTEVGERGGNLSGGQRQRLAIARAALKDPPILVLDEATSALDAATEAEVAAGLSALMQGRTSFIIAHRLSTVRMADEILVFDAGRIIERGGFAELLARDGRFAALVRAQLAA
jgi:glucan exporter ATP-binding protein